MNKNEAILEQVVMDLATKHPALEVGVWNDGIYGYEGQLVEAVPKDSSKFVHCEEFRLFGIELVRVVNELPFVIGVQWPDRADIIPYAFIVFMYTEEKAKRRTQEEKEAFKAFIEMMADLTRQLPSEYQATLLFIAKKLHCHEWRRLLQ